LGVALPAYAASPADCAAVADRAARNQGSVIGGAAHSATRGAVFGAIVGDGRKGARRGATLGAVVGGARTAVQRDQVYQWAYDDCMRGQRY
jgi:hypothetical protein